MLFCDYFLVPTASSWPGEQLVQVVCHEDDSQIKFWKVFGTISSYFVVIECVIYVRPVSQKVANRSIDVCLLLLLL